MSRKLRYIYKKEIRQQLKNNHKIFSKYVNQRTKTKVTENNLFTNRKDKNQQQQMK